MNDILGYILPPIATGLIAFFTGRKMQKTQIEGNELSNVRDSIEIYRDIIEDLKRQMDEMKKSIFEIDEDNKRLHKEIETLKQENERLRKNSN